MYDYYQADEAFKKIINHGPTAAIRKSAKQYWYAYNSVEGPKDSTGKKFVESIKKAPVEYKQPAFQCLEDFNTCMENNNNSTACYFALAVCFAERIIPLTGNN